MLLSAIARIRIQAIKQALLSWIGFCWLGLALCQAQPFQDRPLLKGSQQALPSGESRTKAIVVRWDAFHANTWIESPLVPGASDWHLLHGPSRAAEALRQMGCDCDTQIGPWTSESLEGVDLVIIPLASVNRPSFLVSEIAALVSFVDRGGGLLVMTDAANQNYHNHALGALFDSVGMQLSDCVVCEPTHLRLGDRASWIRLGTFSDHPMLRGIENMCMLDAGVVDARYGVVWSSKESWGDIGSTQSYALRDQGKTPGDGQPQPSEPKGPMAVVAARAFGRGRIVVLADPDFVGSTFLNYADHRRFWLQASLWCAIKSHDGVSTGSESSDRDWAANAGALVERGLAGESGRTKIWCYEPLKVQEHYWGDPAPSGMFHAFAMLNRYADARSTDRPWLDAEWLILPDAVLLDRDDVAEQAIAFAAQPGRRLAILCDKELAPCLQTIERKFTNAKPPKTSPGGWVTQELPRGSQVVLIPNRSAWANQTVPSPEKPLNSADRASEQQRMGWLIEGGLLPVPSVDDRVLWPDD